MLPPFVGGPIKAPSVDASYLWMYTETARSLYWSMADKEVRATSTSRPGCQRFHLSNLSLGIACTIETDEGSPQRHGLGYIRLAEQG